MKKILLILSVGFIVFTACKDKDFLNNPPYGILTDDKIFSSADLALSALAELYDGYVDYQTITNWPEYASFDEAFPSQGDQYGRVQNAEYGYGSWGMWNYGYLRNINLFIKKLKASTQIDVNDKTRLLAEARFLRAANYFEMVKRMGGVPLITEPLTYDYSGDATYLQYPRAKEYEIYDFVLAELDTIKNMLPDNVAVQDRASKGVCLAMQARAAVYAGSIARYGATTPEVSLPGNEVGIPASMAMGYYQKARDAAMELVTSNKYSLYKKNPNNLSENFSALFYDKTDNPEVIFTRNFKLKTGRVHGWTIDNQPKANTEDAQTGGRLNPSLNLAMQFEKLDNTFAPFATNNSASETDFVYYSNPLEIFAGRDARLAGTFILPGSLYKGRNPDIWAGYILPSDNFRVITSNQMGGQQTLPGRDYREQVVGFSGPIDGLEFTAQTGFYVRKFMDPATGSGQLGTGSEVWWVRYRYAEVLLNLAEAEFELDNKAASATYLNQVRERAGLMTPLTAGQITFDRIVHERRVELAFEGHELFDNKRWRIAHKVWNGEPMGLDYLDNLGKADASNTMVMGLWPYKIYNPGKPNDGKWVFKMVRPRMVTQAHRFRLGNYYSWISDDIRNNNPKIVKQPNQ